jgi:hypothetical protein
MFYTHYILFILGSLFWGGNGGERGKEDFFLGGGRGLKEVFFGEEKRIFFLYPTFTTTLEMQPEREKERIRFVGTVTVEN